MNENKQYPKCFVPTCSSTKINSPHKIFYVISKDEKRRKLWFQAAGQRYSMHSNLYCCSDHFNVSIELKKFN